MTQEELSTTEMLAELTDAGRTAASRSGSLAWVTLIMLAVAAVSRYVDYDVALYAYLAGAGALQVAAIVVAAIHDRRCMEKLPIISRRAERGKGGGEVNDVSRFSLVETHNMPYTEEGTFYAMDRGSFFGAGPSDVLAIVADFKAKRSAWQEKMRAVLESSSDEELAGFVISAASILDDRKQARLKAKQEPANAP